MEGVHSETVYNVYRPLIKYRDTRRKLHVSQRLPTPLDDLEPRLLVIPRKAMSKRFGTLQIEQANQLAFETIDYAIPQRVSATITEARSTPNGQVLFRPTERERIRLNNTSSELRNKFHAAQQKNVQEEFELYRFSDADDAAKVAKELNAGFIGYVLLFGSVRYNMRPNGPFISQDKDTGGTQYYP